jgi:Zn-dependent peptidase ImmA (M78 family)
MRCNRKPKRRAYAIAEIASFARLLRKLLAIHDRSGTNLLEIFPLLQKAFPKLRLRIVANDMLSGGEARAYPTSWIIKIRQSVLDGLLRGDYGARWTLAHELGHVLLQHPGRPFRNRHAANDVVEREAHTFAAEFLAPAEYVKKYQSAEKIQTICQISLEAAQRRIDEVSREERSKRFGTKRKPLTSTLEFPQSENHAAAIYAAISATITENADLYSIVPFSENIFSTSILVAKGAQLLLDSYESLYGPHASNDLTCAAAVAASILAINPIREIGTPVSRENEIARLNEICALKATANLLKITIDHLEVGSLSKNTSIALITFPSDYLRNLLVRGQSLITSPSSMIHFFELPSYNEYNARSDISWVEITALKKIISLFDLLRSTAAKRAQTRKI